jgi:hypothetical protein
VNHLRLDPKRKRHSAIRASISKTANASGNPALSLNPKRKTHPVIRASMKRR